MSRRRGRAGPSDPQEILLANAQARAQARLRDKTPGEWGVSAEIFVLPSAVDVELNLDQRGKVLAAKRSDPFDLLHGAGSLTDDQHRAARRLFRDWALRAGVRDGERRMPEKVDGGRADPGGLTQAMVDAGKRIAVALVGVGPVNKRLLGALISPMVDHGLVIVWRGTVQRVTAERDRNAQGALVRQACESLRIVYQAMDDRSRLALVEGKATEVRPFSSFEPVYET